MKQRRNAGVSETDYLKGSCKFGISVSERATRTRLDVCLCVKGVCVEK